MTTPELEPSPLPATAGAAATGLGVAGVNLASTSTSSPSSPSITRTPRWGSLRQRFSSIHSRDSFSVPVDSVDDGMWDKNDAAFLEQVARDSPLLLSSPHRFDDYTGRASMSSSRVNGLSPQIDAEQQAGPSRRQSYQPSSPYNAASTSSTAFPFPASIPVHDPAPTSSMPPPAPASARPVPHSMRKMSSRTALPDLPEQKRVDGLLSFSRPSTSSSSTASMGPPLLPPIASSSSFTAASFANTHLLRSPGARSSVHSSVGSSPILAQSVPAASDAARSTNSDLYPRPPSLHSSSSFPASGYVFRSLDDRAAGMDARARTNSSSSAASSALASSSAATDRRPSRSVMGSPLAVGSSFTSYSRPSSPEVLPHDQLPTRTAAEGSESTAAPPGDDAATARAKREATASMRGMPASPRKRSSVTVAPTSPTLASPPIAVEPVTNGATANAHLRKHTKNKSSLVSGLRKLMGKRDKDGTALPHPTTTELASSSKDNRRSLQSNAKSIDASGGSGLNLLGLAPDALGSQTTVQVAHDHSDSPAANANATAPALSRSSPSVDLLRNVGNSPKPSPADASQQAVPPSSRSRTMSIDIARPLREVLLPHPRKDSSNRAAARTSVIEHISHEEVRRLTGNSGPIILQTQQQLVEHRSRYNKLAPALGLPDIAHFDMHHVGADNADASEQTASQDADPVELLTPSNSGEEAISNSVDGGMASSASSFVSTSTGATGASATLRAPFSFQSQSYRPYSRESRTSSKVQPSPDSSPCLDTASGTLKPSHRSVLSLGSHGDQTPNAFAQSASALMPPPAGVPSKRGHSSRRSLNSLVANRPWSSFLGSPALGSSSSLSHAHHKRVSAASISRPLSVSSSAFSNDFNGAGGDSDAAAALGDLTMRASDFGRTADVSASSRVRLDSIISEPACEPSAGAVGATNSSWSSTTTHARSSWQFPSPPPRPPSGLYSLAFSTNAPAAGPAAPPASSSSSHHSHQSHTSHQSYHSYHSTTSAPARPSASASHRLIPTSSSSSSLSNSALRQHQAHPPHPLRRPTTGDGSSSPALTSTGSFHSVGASLIQSSSLENLGNERTVAKAPATALGFSSAPRPSYAGHRLSASGSSLSHRKRPSFGLAIEPAAHSAFDCIPSPLLRTRRTSLALPEGAAPERPFSTSSASASAARTPSASSFSTSPNDSARASAATLSSSTHDHDDSVEIETLRDGSPVKASYRDSIPLLASVPALESAMAAASLRPSVSVPMDEGDSPRQHMEDNWSRATGGAAAAAAVFAYGDAEHAPQQQQQHVPRQYMIHSPNEEEGPALAAHASASSSGRLSQASKDIAFGSIAGMVSKVFEHPFDLVKVRLQTQSADRPARYAGAFDCFKQTYLQEGIRGLYRGLSMPVLGATLENACLFFTYNQIQSAIRWFNGEARSSSAAKADAESPLSIPQLAIAAAGAGSVTSVVLTPIELIKCKMQVQMITREQRAPAVVSPTPQPQPQLQQTRSLYTSAVRSAAASSQPAQTLKTLDGPLALLRHTVATDGIRGLWLGQTGTLLRETGGGIAWFLAFESCSRHLIARKKLQWKRDDVSKKDLSSLELVGAGALAGVSYNVVLFPADSVKSTMQTEQEMRLARAGESWKRTGFYDTFKKIYSTRGVRGLYAGCGVTCLRSAPSSAIIFLMYNKLEKLSDEYAL
ncbi:related to mitochondrial amino acid transporter ARG-13 [Sporisorium reilianum SRZ2]|uniref:Related to mitochondrial amino acid transporter ARG-13 n=1 Tax=Sporisorium reilianum (strain SRZ2) TaxID=999809 RepID=E6ZNA7_SPORE|nr:related to mitochondrial amino acid transporter ARG-13 [Sporisorium reilianum SRZ2]